MLRNALSSAERDELVTRNVAKLVQIPTPRYKVGKGLRVTDVKKILREAVDPALRALRGRRDARPPPRGAAGAALEDLDLDRATLTVAQTVQRVAGQATRRRHQIGGSDATVPLPKVTGGVPVEHRQRQDKERLTRTTLAGPWSRVPDSVGTPIEPRSLNRHFHGIRTRAGLPDVRLHDLRHTVVSLLLALGTPPYIVQAIARHADLDVTLSIYAHTNLDAMREALDKIDWEIW